MNKRILSIFYVLLHEALEREQVDFPPTNVVELRQECKRMAEHYNDCRCNTLDPDDDWYQPTALELRKQATDYARMNTMPWHISGHGLDGEREVA
tara:strand:+ start:271 stop:555 length:285 start_codon:yes stop_codon:yes gene_type:complete